MTDRTELRGPEYCYVLPMPKVRGQPLIAILRMINSHSEENVTDEKASSQVDCPEID